MATAKNKENETHLEAFGDVEQDGLLAFEKIKSAFAAGDDDVVWKITIHRAGNIAGGAVEPWLFSCSPEQIDDLSRGDPERVLTYVRDHYGNGLYRARVTCNGIMRKRLTFAVETQMENAILPNDNAPVLHALGETNRSLVALAERMSRGPENQPISRPDWLTHLPGIVTAIATAIVPLKEVFAPKTDTGMIEVFKMALELGRSSSGDGAETNAMDLLKSFVDSGGLNTLMQARANPVQTAIGNRQSAVENQQTVPQPIAAVPSKPELSKQPVQPMPEPVEELRRELNFLCTKAAKWDGSPDDIEWAADYLLFRYDEDFIRQMIATPNLYQVWVQLCSNVAKYDAWFATLLGTLKRVLEREPELAPGQESIDMSGQGSRTDASENGLAGADTGRSSGHSRNAQNDALTDPQSKSQPGHS